MSEDRSLIGINVLVTRVAGLQRADLERWIAHEWVRPELGGEEQDRGVYLFREIDVARVRLILELRDEMRIDEEALPLVLSLLDQLYDQRRRMRALSEALEAVAPEDVRRALAQHLAKREAE